MAGHGPGGGPAGRGDADRGAGDAGGRSVRALRHPGHGARPAHLALARGHPRARRGPRYAADGGQCVGGGHPVRARRPCRSAAPGRRPGPHGGGDGAAAPVRRVPGDRPGRARGADRRCDAGRGPGQRDPGHRGPLAVRTGALRTGRRPDGGRRAADRAGRVRGVRLPGRPGLHRHRPLARPADRRGRHRRGAPGARGTVRPAPGRRHRPAHGHRGLRPVWRRGVPTVYWLLGVTGAGPWRRARDGGPPVPPNHAPEFAPDARTALPTGIAAMASAARRLLAPAGAPHDPPERDGARPRPRDGARPRPRDGTRHRPRRPGRRPPRRYRRDRRDHRRTAAEPAARPLALHPRSVGPDRITLRIALDEAVDPGAVRRAVAGALADRALDGWALDGWAEEPRGLGSGRVPGPGKEPRDPRNP